MQIHLHDRTLLDPAVYTGEVCTRHLRQDPSKPAAAHALATAIRGDTGYDRESLARILLEYNTHIGNDAAALEHCRSLSDAGTLAVVTGQQAGMLSGPLYTTFKIVTAINLADHYSKLLDTRVVPIFWNATEDHDRSEIAAFSMPGHRWDVPFPTGGYAAESLTLTAACRAVLTEFTGGIAAIDHREVIESLASCPHDAYGPFSSSVIARLFSGTGLVILEPRLLRQASIDFFHRAIGEHQEVRQRLGDAARDLVQDGISPSFEPQGNGTGLYHIGDVGIRRRIRVEDDRLFVGNESYDTAAAQAAIRANPQQISTGAYLRPVLQSLRLPTLIYVAGPAEYRYHMQLAPLFELFGARMPLLMLRNHGTLVTQKEAKLASRLEMSGEDFFRGPQAFYGRIPLTEEQATCFAVANAHLETAVAALRRQLDGLLSDDQSQTLTRRLHREVERFRQKTHRAYLRRLEVDNGRIDRLFAVVYPNGKLQERVINVLYFIQKNGLKLIPDLIEALNPLESRHYMIYTEN